MALTLAALREVPVLKTEMTVYFRTAFIPPSGPPDPLIVNPNAGRWPTEWTLYTAQLEAIAWAEYCRNKPVELDSADITGGVGITAEVLNTLGSEPVGDAMPSRALYELTFSFSALADLTNEWARVCLQKAGFDLESFYSDASDGYGDCPDLAARVDELGWEAIVVPSAAWRHGGGYCVPVFTRGKERLEGQKLLYEAARPSVALAAATSFQSGQRPQWLG